MRGDFHTHAYFEVKKKIFKNFCGGEVYFMKEIFLNFENFKEKNYKFQGLSPAPFRPSLFQYSICAISRDLGKRRMPRKSK